MRLVQITDGFISLIIESETLEDGFVHIHDDLLLVSADVRFYTEDWHVKPDEQLIAEGLIPDPSIAVRKVLVDGIKAESARRRALGFDYDFGGARGIHHIGTTDQDMRGWDDVTRWATAQNVLGKTDTLYISTDTGITQVSALDWFSIQDAGAAAMQPIWQAQFILEAMPEIPENYTDDQYWP